MTVIFTLFKDSKESFGASLDEASIEYHPVAALSTTIMASGTLISIAHDVIQSGAVAAVLIAWLRARSSRKIIVTTIDLKVVQIEGYSVAEVEKLLKSATTVAVIDTRPAELTNKCDAQ